MCFLVLLTLSKQLAEEAQRGRAARRGREGLCSAPGSRDGERRSQAALLLCEPSALLSSLFPYEFSSRKS